MLSIATINVGGTQFVTTTETLRPLTKLYRRIESTTPTAASGSIFFDRDAPTFTKILKLLRGYPCSEYMMDTDVMNDLVHWEHEMLQTPIPVWLTAQQLTVHTLDPQQTQSLGTTHVLLTNECIERLANNRLIDHTVHDYVVCIPIGASQGWIDSAWIPRNEFDTALLRCRFALYFKFLKDQA